MKTKIAILGAGSFGTAIAKLICSYEKYDIILWSVVKEEIEEIKKNKENIKYLPNIKIDTEKIILTTDNLLLKNADIIIFAVASKYVRSVAKSISKYIKKDAIIVNVAKGLEQESFKRLSQVIYEETNSKKIVALCGPSHAEEIAKFIPTTIVASCEDLKIAEYIQEILNSSIFRVYVNEDIIGVEIAAALKNIIALAVGICDGLNLGDNTKAALMTRGLFEIARVGVFLGAKEKTFLGLAGIGDLIVTCTSEHSRNKKAGFLIGKGIEISKALEKVNMVVEGYYATKAAYEFSNVNNIYMPITKELYEILYEKKDIKMSIKSLMSRKTKHEYEKF